MFTKINDILKRSLLAKDKESVETLKLLKSAILLEAKRVGQVSPDGELCEKILRQQIKMRHDTLEVYKNAGVPPDQCNEVSEIRILESFLPKQISADELLQIIEEEVRKSDLELSNNNMKPLIDLITTRVGQSASKADVARALHQRMTN